MLGITIGVNLLVLATQVYDQMRTNHDAGQNSALRQPANNALIRVPTLGQTTLQWAFEQVGHHNALKVAAQNAATAASALQNGNDPQPDPNQSFIDGMDQFLDQV
ncbi:hypothetical protein [Streptomyces capitiformicae]|nr:hypothetical protein [Streptomyces capitiformicae]